MNTKREHKDKGVGWAVSLFFHGVLILLFFLINAWTAPDPPLPEYGIELNLGLEQAGFGAEEPVTEPAPAVEEEQDQPEPQEEIVEEPEPVAEEQPVEEPQPAEPEAVEETAPDSQQEDSPLAAEPENAPEEAKPVEEKVEEKPKSVEKTQPEKPVEKPKPVEKKVDTKALYPGSKSQGDTPDKAGDTGIKEGTVDSRALYGKQGGGGGGPRLDLAGWRWDYEPKPDDKSKENGRIVFEIKVDDNGDVIAVRTLEKTVSPAVERIYRREVEKLTFSPTSDNTIHQPISTGKITFIIRSK